jgi:hypothetical protein
MDEMIAEYYRRNHLGEPGIDGRMKLNLISKKWSARSWTKYIWLRIGSKRGLLLSR